MNTESRIVALSLSLAAGAGTGAAMTGLGAPHLHLWALGCCLLMAVLLLLLTLPSFPAPTGNLPAGAFLCYPLMFLLGILCYFTAIMPPASGGSITRIEEAATGLRAAIDAIPFPHESTAPLLKAFLTGDRSGLPRETVAMFRRSGASHLLALSGLHIGIIYTIFSRALLILGHSPAARVIRFLITVPAALLFTLMTGASPSIVRAFLFITLSELTALLGRRRQSLRIFSVALTVQLVITPGVITSVGFQLSYSAMLGIFLLFPPMQRWYPAGGPRFNPVRKLWEMAALSIACQVTAAPVAWLYFRTFPRYFLITNILALPLTTICISLGIASLALSAASLCPNFLLTATDAAASLLLRCLEIIAAM